MASGFVLSGRVSLSPPSAAQLKAISGFISSQLGSVKGNINLNISPNVQKQLNTVNKSLNETSKVAKEAGNSLFNFGKQSGYAVQRFFALTVATTAFFSFTRSFVKGIRDAIEFEREMIKLRQVTNSSLKDLKGFSNEVTRLATTLGVSSRKILDVGVVLAQAGLNAKQTTVALQALAKSELAPSFDDMISTTEAAVAVFQQFKVQAKDLESVLGSINAVSAKFAVEASDISAVIKRTGGAFAAAGGDLNELIALFTSVRQTTRESAESIATGFRTIFTRIQRLRTIDFLGNLGIQLRDFQGQFIGPYKAIEKLNLALTQISGTDPRFSQIIEELGGFRQVSKVIPLIQQFATAQKALRVAQQGTNSLSEDAAKAQDSLAVKISKVKEEFASLIRAFTETSQFQTIINVALKLSSAFITVAKSLEGILPLLAIFGSASLGKALSPFAGGIKSVFTKGAIPVTNKFASGGNVPGSGNKDNVPALLTPGEFVINKRSASRIGIPELNRLNKGGIIRFGKGGQVPEDLIDTIIKGTVGVDKIARPSSRDYIKEQLISRGYDIDDKNVETLTNIAKSARKLSIEEKKKGITTPGNETIQQRNKVRDFIAANFIKDGEKLTKEQKENKRFDIQLGGPPKSPTFGGLFLGLHSTANTTRVKDKIPKKLLEHVQAKAKSENFNIDDSSKLITNFAFGGINKKSRDGIKDYIFSLFSSSISKVVENFGQGLGVSPSDKASINAIAKNANLAGVEGGIFEGFVSAVSNNVSKGSKDIFDIVGGVSDNPGIKKLFGDIPDTVKYSDVKNSSKNLIKDLVNKAVKLSIRDNSLINFIPSTDIKVGNELSFGEELPKNFATGGLVPGQGNTDSVRANLTPGEFVIRKKAVEAIGVNKLSKINRFARGGLITREQLAKELDKAQATFQNRYLQTEATGTDFPIFQPLIPTGTNFLGNGIQAVALKTPDNKVLRFTDHSVGKNFYSRLTGNKLGERPQDEEFLQAIKTVYGKNIQLELLPFANVIGGSQGRKRPNSQYREQLISNLMAKRFLSQGKFPFDTHQYNLGFVRDAPGKTGRSANRIKIIDPDAVGTNKSLIRNFLARVEDKDYYEKMSPINQRRHAFIYQEIQNHLDKFPFLRGYNFKPLPNVPKANKFLSGTDTAGPNDITKVAPFASGGKVGTDTVPALLTPGEFVINKRAATRIGINTLNKLNNADSVQKFANGGAVQKFANGGTPDRQGGISTGGLLIGLGSIPFLLQQLDGLSDGFRQLINTITSATFTFSILNSSLKSFAKFPEKFNPDVINNKFDKKLQTSTTIFDAGEEDFKNTLAERNRRIVAARQNNENRKGAKDFIHNQFRAKNKAIDIIKREEIRQQNVANNPNFRPTARRFAASNVVILQQARQKHEAQLDKIVKARTALTNIIKKEYDGIQKNLDAQKDTLKQYNDLRQARFDQIKAIKEERQKELIAAEDRRKFQEIALTATAVFGSASIAGGTALSQSGTSLLNRTEGKFGGDKVKVGDTLVGAGIGAVIGSQAGQVFGPLGIALGAAGGGVIGGLLALEQSSIRVSKEINKLEFSSRINKTFDKLDRAINGKISTKSTISDIRLLSNDLEKQLSLSTGSDFETAIGQRKEFTEKLQVILDDVAKGSTDFEQFITKLGGQDKVNVLFDNLARTVGTTTSQLNKEFDTLIKTTNKQNQLLKNVNQAREQEFIRLQLINNLNKAIGTASNNLNPASINTIKGQATISTTKSPANDAFIDSFGSFFGSQAGSFTSELKQSFKAQDTIARALVNVRSINPLANDSTDANTAILTELSNLGITDANVRRIIQTQVAGIIGPEAKDARFFEALNEDIEGVTNKIVDALDTVPKVFFEFTDKLISVNNEYLSLQRERIESEKDLVKGVQEINVLRKGAEEFSARAENRRPDFALLAGLTEGRRQSILTAGSGTRLGLGRFAGSSPTALGTEIANLNRNIQLQTFRLESGEPDKLGIRGKLTSEIVKQTETVSRLTSVLEFMADTGNAVADAQAKFESELTDRQVKQSFTEGFVFSDTSGRRDIEKNIAATLTVLKTKDINSISATSRQGVFGLLNTFKDVKLGAFGGKTGQDIITEITKNAGFDIKGVTSPGAAEEKARLEVLAAFKTAEESRTELNKILATQSGDLNRILELQFGKFLTDLNSELKKLTESDVGLRSAEFIGTGATFKGVESTFAQLQKLGVSRTVLEDTKELERLRNQIETVVNIDETKKDLKRISNFGISVSSELIKQVPDGFLANAKQSLTDFREQNVGKILSRQGGGGLVGSILGFSKDANVTSLDRIQSLAQQFSKFNIDINKVDADANKILSISEEQDFINNFKKGLSKQLPEATVNRIVEGFRSRNSEVNNEDFRIQTGSLSPPKLGEKAFTTSIFNFVEILNEVIKSETDTLTNLLKESADLSQFGDIDTSNLVKIANLLTELPENLNFKELRTEVGNAEAQFNALNKAINPTIDFFTEVEKLRARQNIVNNLSQIPPKPYAKGGIVPGSGNRDTIPAMLTPGEFVVNKTAAMKHGGLLRAMNYADGGSVNNTNFLGRYLLERQKRKKTEISDFDFSRNDYGGLKQEAIKQLGFKADYASRYSEFQAVKERVKLLQKIKVFANPKGDRLPSTTTNSIQSEINKLAARPSFSGGAPPNKQGFSKQFLSEYPEFAFFEGLGKSDEGLIKDNLRRFKEDNRQNKRPKGILNSFMEEGATTPKASVLDESKPSITATALKKSTSDLFEKFKTIDEANKFLKEYSESIGLDLNKIGVVLSPGEAISDKTGTPGSVFSPSSNSILFPPNGLTKRSLLHELGHAIDFKLGSGNYASKIPGSSIDTIGFKFGRSSTYKNIIDKALESRGITDKAARDEFLSTYGETNSTEAFAEAFARFSSGEGAKKFIKDSGLGIDMAKAAVESKNKNKSTFGGLSKEQRDAIKARSQARRDRRSRRLGLSDSSSKRISNNTRRLMLMASKGNLDALEQLNKAQIKESSRGLGIANFALFGLPFASGGTVPAMLTPGELVFGPSAVSKIGVNNLNKMNDVVKVPGIGNRDSVYGSLSSGSFVLNKKSSKLLNRETGGSVLASMSGSSAMNSIKNSITNLTGSGMRLEGMESFNTAVANFGGNAAKLSQALDNMPREISFVGRMTHEVIVTGGEALSESIKNKLTPVFAEMVEQIIDKQIQGMKKDFGMNNG